MLKPLIAIIAASAITLTSAEVKKTIETPETQARQLMRTIPESYDATNQEIVCWVHIYGRARNTATKLESRLAADPSQREGKHVLFSLTEVAVRGDTLEQTRVSYGLDNDKPVEIKREVEKHPFPIDTSGQPVKPDELYLQQHLPFVTQQLQLQPYYLDGVKMQPDRFDDTKQTLSIRIPQMGNTILQEKMELTPDKKGDRKPDITVCNYDKTDGTLTERVDYLDVRKDGTLELRAYATRTVPDSEIADYKLSLEYKRTPIAEANLVVNGKQITDGAYVDGNLVLRTGQARIAVHLTLQEYLGKGQMPHFIIVGKDKTYCTITPKGTIEVFTSDKATPAFSKDCDDRIAKIRLTD